MNLYLELHGVIFAAKKENNANSNTYARGGRTLTKLMQNYVIADYYHIVVKQIRLQECPDSAHFTALTQHEQLYL